jgi:hypothetical protein
MKAKDVNLVSALVQSQQYNIDAMMNAVVDKKYVPAALPQAGLYYSSSEFNTIVKFRPTLQTHMYIRFAVGGGIEVTNGLKQRILVQTWRIDTVNHVVLRVTGVYLDPGASSVRATVVNPGDAGLYCVLCLVAE